MAMVDLPVILQIVGYQNSGKTTAMYEVIQRLSLKGQKVVTIKHHGHGGKPDIAEGKDSARHVEGGALASLIEGEGRVLLHAEQSEWTLKEQIHLLLALSPDIVLIEGHKHEGYPKAVLLRDESDFHLLDELDNIKVVYCFLEDLAYKLPEQLAYPVVSSRVELYNWIEDYVLATKSSS
ncbi:molybdopterin-guanine dinucleotide biosynthesis protein B [Mesobacillus persicus]|uniref:Molybdopterin-guanine dinucleotide biosynthesis protein B n=2 Tax=Mesobacillus persicus TaxID=930146 RepID=A0A1H8E455_9BACI|nr:molybdopterin-guanine dinucleotide biosynthesis protein B [Mesobacillus persicus]